MPKTVMNGFLNKSRAGSLAGRTLLLVGCLLIGTTAAQAAVESEVVFVFNTFSFLLWGALVM
ncbi:MAG: ammonium transporter, partial [Acidobacteriota bacterium]|nr:ammonium transporter [Acidobacteriota bacterium]